LEVSPFITYSLLSFRLSNEIVLHFSTSLKNSLKKNIIQETLSRYDIVDGRNPAPVYGKIPIIYRG